MRIIKYFKSYNGNDESVQAENVPSEVLESAERTLETALKGTTIWRPYRPEDGALLGQCWTYAPPPCNHYWSVEYRRTVDLAHVIEMADDRYRLMSPKHYWHPCEVGEDDDGQPDVFSTGDLVGPFESRQQARADLEKNGYQSSYFHLY